MFNPKVKEKIKLTHPFKGKVIISFEQAKAIAQKVERIERAVSKSKPTLVLNELPKNVTDEAELPDSGIFIRYELTTQVFLADVGTSGLSAAELEISLWLL